MTVVDGILIGAAGMVVLYAVFLALRKTWTVASDLGTAMRTVPPAVKSIQELVEVAKGFQQELAYMRAVASGQIPPSPNFGVENPTDAPSEPRTPVAYPAPIFDRFPSKPDAPDAEPGDGVSFAQTDEEMAEEEKLENLIDMGLAHREEVMPQGREVDSE